jgi:hypothetical protein
MIIEMQVDHVRLQFSRDWAQAVHDRARLTNINVPGPSRYGTDLGMTHRAHGAPVTYRCGDEITTFSAAVVAAVNQIENAPSWAAAQELENNWSAP